MVIIYITFDKKFQNEKTLLFLKFKVIAPIIRSLVIAKEKGLKIPLIFTTGGYDSVEGIKLLDGIIDIYVCDMKFGDNKNAVKYASKNLKLIQYEIYFYFKVQITM